MTEVHQCELAQIAEKLLRPDGRVDWQTYSEASKAMRPELDLTSHELAFNNLLRIMNVARNAGKKVVAADIITVLEDQFRSNA